MSYIEENGYFIFGEVKSSDYGVWISGGGTYNAPARRYKEYVVPGRNGTLTIDEGAYEEVEVTYPAFIARDFPANVEAFRNAIMAQNGYVRMTDSYHPDEFYLARYMAGLEVDTLPGGRGGSFELTFKRDPRRFLLSGEEAIPYSRHSKNLLKYPYPDTTKEAEGINFVDDGYGTITANGQRTNDSIPRFNMATKATLLPYLENGETYIISGCPSDGGWGKYYISMYTGSSYVYDLGEGAEFVFDASAAYMNIVVLIETRNAIEGVTFSPMIRKASDPDGWVPFVEDGAGNINNPTLFLCNPLIRVTGDGTVGIGDTTITISPGYEYVDIDSEIQNCYCGLQNANALVSFSTGKFPTLQPGINGITMSGNVTEVQITPRWFIL